MRLPVWKSTLVVGLCAFFGIAWSLWRSRPAIQLTPEFVIAEGIAAEGETVSVPIMLSNHSRHPFLISDVKATCGCTGLYADNERLAAGRVIAARSSLLLKLRNNTTRRPGVNEYQVAVLGSFQGNKDEVTITARARFQVDGGLRANPPEVFLSDAIPGNTMTTEVTLFDGSHDQPLKLDQTVLSNPQQMGVRLTPVAPPTEVTEGQRAPFTERYRCEIKFTSSDTSLNERGYVEFRPSDRRFSPLRVPIVLRKREAPLSFPSATLVVPLDSDEEFVRRIVPYRLRGDVQRTINVISKPEAVQVDVGASNVVPRTITVIMPTDKMARLLPFDVIVGDQQDDEFRGTLHVVGPPALVEARR